MRRRKKKIPTLPQHITPVLPEYDTNKFNEMSNVDMGSVSANTSGGLSESMRSSDVEKLRQELVDACYDYLYSQGFEDDDVDAYTAFECEEEEDRIKFEIRTDFGYDMMGELCMVLDPILQKYDKDAYFDFVDGGIIDAYVYKNNGLAESLKRVDRTSYERLGESLDLQTLCEAVPLSSQDKTKLANFVKKTSDPEEIENYLVGLVTKKQNKNKTPKPMQESYFDDEVDVEDEYEEFGDECKYNLSLPKDVELYLDEFDIEYGKLPSGKIYMSDYYEVLGFRTKKDFVYNTRYNIKETADMYFENPDDYDYSDEFIQVLKKAK